MKKMFLIFLCFLFQNNYLHCYDLGTIVVSASKIAEENFENKTESFSSVDIITKEQIKEKTVSLFELLENIPGIQTKKYGGFDDYAEISIRGSSSEQVSVLIDGIPINNPLGGGANISSIPLSSIEKIETYRGGAPFSLGAQAIGGIINIKTLSPKKDGFDVSVSAGSFGFKNAGFSYCANKKNFSVITDFQYSEADNDFKYVNDNSTHLIKEDDFTETRKNNYFKKFSAFAKLDYLFSDIYSFKTAVSGAYEKKGLSGVFYNASESAKLNNSDYLIQSSVLRKKFFSMPGSMEFSFYYKNNAENFFDPNREIGWAKRDTNDKTNRFGSSVSTEFYLSENSKSSLSAYYNKVKFSPEDNFGNNQFMSQKRDEIKVSAEHLILLLSEKLRISSGAMIERFENQTNGGKKYAFAKNPEVLKKNYFSKQFGLNYKINKKFSVKSSAGSFYRIPNMFELFGDKGYTVGNSGLKPEKSFNLDAGAVGIFKFENINVSAEIIGFYRSVKNLIQWLNYSTQIMFPDNIGKADLRGIESNLNISYKSFYYKNSSTILKTKNKEKAVRDLNRRLPAKPEYDVFNELGFYSKQLGLKLYVQYNYTGESYKDIDNKFKNESKEFANAGVSYSYKNAAFNIEIKNLTDEMNQDVYGFPLPGRSYYAKIN
ncbi:MAG TPA: TonB-dependent receptor [bacterium]|nr:TonB-dependent receptor [bacterium]